MPNMLIGMVLRSPHAHARIRRIDLSKALALDGVKAIVLADDFPTPPPHRTTISQYMSVNLREVLQNVIAHNTVFYEGHAIAAVAATKRSIARKALNLIEVDFDILPHVIDVDQALQVDAPVLHPTLITEGVDPPPMAGSNLASRIEFSRGDLGVGFEAADYRH